MTFRTMRILLQISLILFMLLQTMGLDEKVAKSDPIAVKNEHQKEILKIVADRIYSTLGHTNLIVQTRPTVEDEANNVLLSVMSMAMGHEVSASPAESTTKFLEKLTKLISEASTQFQKHSQPVEHQLAVTSKFATDANIKIGPKGEALLPSPTPKTTIFLKPLNNKLGDLLIKTPMDGKSIVLPANVKVQRKTSEDVKIHEVKSVPDKTQLDVQKKETEQPVLKLMPHVIFVDNDGREFKLVGVGKQPTGCKNGDCLSVDEKSKEVLAFKKPGSKEYLVLADHSGQEFFTSGVQLCEPPTKFGRSTYSAPNLGLLTPHIRREVHIEDEDDITVQWEKEADPSHLKRESGKNALGPDEFKKDVDTLFNSEGMQDVVNTPNAKPDKLLEAVTAKGKERFLAREKPFHRRRRRHRNMRGRHVAVSADQVSNTSFRKERQTGQETSENEWQKKLLEALKDDSKDLDLLGGRRALVDAAECQGNCELKRRKRSLDLDNGADLANSLDVMKNTIMEVPVAVRGSPNSSCTDCSDGRPADEKRKTTDLKGDFKVIAIEPNSMLGQSSADGEAPTIAPKLPDEEFNMIQPSTAPDEEDRVLFTDDFHRVPLMATTFPAFDFAGVPWMLDSLTSPKPLYWPNEFNVYETLPVQENLPGLEAALFPEWTPAPISEGNADAGENSFTGEPPSLRLEDGEQENKNGLNIAELGSQFAQSILLHVKSSNKMKQVLGAGLQLNPVKVSRNPIASHSPQYDASLNILLKTLMLNIEKIAEDDIQYRTCAKLENDLRYFLNTLVGLPEIDTMPDEYHTNIARAERSSSLIFQRDELVNLLDDYRQLPKIEREKTMGVKRFIESELEEVKENMAAPIGSLIHQNVYRASNSRKSKSYPGELKGGTTVSVAQKWLADINPFKRWNLFPASKSEEKDSSLEKKSVTKIS